MSNRITSKLVFDALSSRKSASPVEIADALGIGKADASGQATVRRTLRRLKRRGQVIQDGPRGPYRPTPGGRERLASKFEYMENAIADFLTAKGGVARTSEIQYSCAGKRGRSGAASYENILATQVLAQSPLFEQSFGRGNWNLAQDRLAKLPLLGKWALRQIERSRPVGNPREEARQVHCAVVGWTFRDARAGLEIAEVVAAPIIAAALSDLIFHCSDGTRDAIEALAGITLLNASDAEMPQLHEAAYILFEAGNVGAHWAAPVEFYTGCGRLFGVCPAGLSRGDIPD